MSIGMTVGYTTLSRTALASTLDCIGLRHDTPTYAQMNAEPTKPIIAYCTSEKCCRFFALDRHGYKHVKYKKETHKDVDKSKDNCPDCGHALLWKQANWIRRL